MIQTKKFDVFDYMEFRKHMGPIESSMHYPMVVVVSERQAENLFGNLRAPCILINKQEVAELRA